VTLRTRAFLSLAVGIALAVLFLTASRIAHSEAFLYPQLPGLFAALVIFGLHSGKSSSALALITFGAVNALAYWPLLFGLSYLLTARRKGSN